MHKDICKNNCEFATPGILLSTAGTQKDWLYRCKKLDERLITSDSVIHLVGCATYIYDPNKESACDPDPKVKPATPSNNGYSPVDVPDNEPDNEPDESDELPEWENTLGNDPDYKPDEPDTEPAKVLVHG